MPSRTLVFSFVTRIEASETASSLNHSLFPGKYVIVHWYFLIVRGVLLRDLRWWKWMSAHLVAA